MKRILRGKCAFLSALYLEKQWWLWKKSSQGKVVKNDVATAVWFQIMS